MKSAQIFDSFVQPGHAFAAVPLPYPVRCDDAGSWIAANADAKGNEATACLIGVNNDVLRIGVVGGVYRNTGHGLNLNEYYFLQDGGGLGPTPGPIEQVCIYVVDADKYRLMVYPALAAASATPVAPGALTTLTV